MDIAATNGVLTSLRTGGRSFAHPVLNYKNSGIEPEGRPPPRAPSIYVSVDEGGVQVNGRPSDHDDHIEELHTIIVYINRRLQQTAPDRIQDAYEKLTRGMWVLERQVLHAIHGQQEVRTGANTYAEGLNLTPEDVTGQFQTPLFYTGRSKTLIKNSDWSGEEANDKFAGWIVREMRFVGLLTITPSTGVLS